MSYNQIDPDLLSAAHPITNFEPGSLTRGAIVHIGQVAAPTKDFIIYLVQDEAAAAALFQPEKRELIRQTGFAETFGLFGLTAYSVSAMPEPQRGVIEGIIHPKKWFEKR